MLRRLVDVAALLLIVFVIYKLLIVPRVNNAASAQPAPHVTYATLSGKQFVLSEHRGRVVFLDFWASWCEPCKLSLPLVERYARAHPDVDVLAVDVGEPRPVVAAFARTHDLRNVALDPQTLSQGFFQIQGFPTMIAIDKSGRIRGAWGGFNPAISTIMDRAVRSM